jgi:membrane protein
MSLRRITVQTYRLIRDAYEGFSRDYATHLSAAMAFYTLFAVAPIILIATAVSGLIFGEEAARANVITQLEVNLGPQARDVVVRLLENWQDPSSGFWATLIGTVTTLYLAFRVFDALRDTLDMLWSVRVRPDITWGQLLRKYARSFLLMMLVGPLLLVSTLLSEVMTRIAPYLDRWIGVSVDYGAVIYLLISFGMLTVMFAALFKWLPDVRIHWRDVWFGALVTALLFSLGRTLIGFYLARATTASLFGAAGSLIVLLFWVYYSAQILFFGAEITEVYARRYGQGIEPDETAFHVDLPGGTPSAYEVDPSAEGE